MGQSEEQCPYDSADHRPDGAAESSASLGGKLFPRTEVCDVIQRHEAPSEELAPGERHHDPKADGARFGPS
jgi:hypothetical protein